MFFCLPDTLPACGLFTIGHLVLFLTTALLIAAGLWLSRQMNAAQVRRTVRVVTAVLWGLEAAKITFVLAVTGSRNPNDFIPLYYCSLILYAGLFSSLGKGLWRHIGDVFVATGSVAGGVCFLFFPTTSLPRYPMLHFISLHSFLLHGLMVYLGLLLLWRGVYRIRLTDLKCCAGLVSLTCLAALIFNSAWDATHPDARVANLMFISKNFPGTPVEILYRLTGPLFPIAMWLIQAFVPFLAFYGLQALYDRLKNRRKS